MRVRLSRYTCAAITVLLPLQLCRFSCASQDRASYDRAPMTTYKNPTPTVDAIIELSDGRVVLIERANPPLGVAFPGGFVDEGESLEDACIREAKEETGLDVRLVALLGVYSDPARDPRKHTVSATFIARSDGTPTAGDDASAVRLVHPEDLAAQTFVFDHALMAEDYRQWQHTRLAAPPRPSSKDTP